MTTSRPALASSSAGADPAGPAPTTTASTVTNLSGMASSLTPLSRFLRPGRSRTLGGALGRGHPRGPGGSVGPGRRPGYAELPGQLPEYRGGVGDDPEVGHGRHRAGRVGIHAY